MIALSSQDQDLLIQIFTEETCKSTGGLATSPACQVFRAAYECGILEDPSDSYFTQRLPKGIEEKRSKDEGDSSTLARLISHTAIFMSMTVQLAGVLMIVYSHSMGLLGEFGCIR